jgi:hypothetical protein
LAALLKDNSDDSFIYKDESPLNDRKQQKKKELAEEIEDLMGKQDETTVDLDSTTLNFKNKVNLKDDI